MIDLLAEISNAKNRVEILGILALDIPVLQRGLLEVLVERQDLNVVFLAESDSDLFYRSLSVDTHYSEERVSFPAMKLRRKLLIDLYHRWIDTAGPDSGRRFQLLLVYMPIGHHLIRIDEERIYALPLSYNLPKLGDYEEVSRESARWRQYNSHLSFLMDNDRGGRYTAKPDAEIIELYDQDRAPRGLFPRSSFYETDYHQLVIWDFIFDRTGNLLIHQRGLNAKDNRGMWDKSVGGHVDWSRELHTSKAAVRELVEELFEDELNKDAMAHFTESEKNTVYLGDWRTDKRGIHALEEIKTLRNEWAFFSLPDTLQTSTPRHLPDGTVRRLRVFADCFIFIANRRLSPDNLQKLENSAFRLVTLSQLKTELDTQQYQDEEGETQEFLGSPDLNTIMTGKMRDILEEASELIRLVFDGDR